MRASAGYRLAKLRGGAGYTQTEVARLLTRMLAAVNAAEIADCENDQRLWLVTRLRVEELARVRDAVNPDDYGRLLPVLLRTERTPTAC